MRDIDSLLLRLLEAGKRGIGHEEGEGGRGAGEGGYLVHVVMHARKRAGAQRGSDASQLHGKQSVGIGLEVGFVKCWRIGRVEPFRGRWHGETGGKEVGLSRLKSAGSEDLQGWRAELRKRMPCCTTWAGGGEGLAGSLLNAKARHA